MPSNIISVIKNNIKKKKFRPTVPNFFLACDSKHTYFFFGLVLDEYMIPIESLVSRSKFKVKGHVSLPNLVQRLTQQRFAPEASNVVGR